MSFSTSSSPPPSPWKESAARPCLCSQVSPSNSPPVPGRTICSSRSSAASRNFPAPSPPDACGTSIGSNSSLPSSKDGPQTSDGCWSRRACPTPPRRAAPASPTTPGHPRSSSWPTTYRDLSGTGSSGCSTGYPASASRPSLPGPRWANGGCASTPPRDGHGSIRSAWSCGPSGSPAPSTRTCSSSSPRQTRHQSPVRPGPRSCRLRSRPSPTCPAPIQPSIQTCPSHRSPAPSSCAR